MSGVWVEGATPISDLTERTSAMRSTTQPISASTASSTSKPWAGHGPSARGPDALRTGFSGDRPKLLGQERHEGMQHRVDHVEHVGDRRLRLGLGRRIGRGPLQHRLREFEMPVAEHAPDEPISRVRGVVEAIGLDRACRLRRRRGGLAEDPAIERLARRLTDRNPRRERSRSFRRSARRSKAWSRNCGSLRSGLR